MPPQAKVTDRHEAPDHQESFWDEWKAQRRTAGPTLASMVINRFPWLISLRFVGAMGTNELAAAALATTLFNVTGLSLSVGLSSALTTLTGQARGLLLSKPATTKEQSLGPIVYYYRGLLVQLLFVIPMGLWWIYGVEGVLIRLGQSTTLAHMTAAYLRILAPGLWGYSINWTTTAWLQTLDMADVPAIATAVGLVLHVPINLIGARYGYLGIAAATVFNQLVQPCLVLTYLWTRGASRIFESLGVTTPRPLFRLCEVQTALRSGLLQYLSLAVPGIVLISEWWASEVVIFLGGILDPVALAAMSLYQSINSFCFMFPVSWSIVGAARVGRTVGEGRSGALAALVSVASAGMVSACLAVLLWTLPHDWLPSFFAPSQADVVYETSRTIPLLGWYVLGDGLQAALNGIVKGTGRQCSAMPIVLVAYWVIGIPLAYYGAFVRHEGQLDCSGCGPVALVTGMTVATWTHMLLLAVIVLRTNWNEEIRRARERVGHRDEDYEVVPLKEDEIEMA